MELNLSDQESQFYGRHQVFQKANLATVYRYGFSVLVINYVGYASRTIEWEIALGVCTFLDLIPKEYQAIVLI